MGSNCYNPYATRYTVAIKHFNQMSTADDWEYRSDPSVSLCPLAFECQSSRT